MSRGRVLALLLLGAAGCSMSSTPSTVDEPTPAAAPEQPTPPSDTELTTPPSDTEQPTPPSDTEQPTPPSDTEQPTPPSDTELTLKVLDPAVPISMPLDQFLGQTRASNEALLGPPTSEHAGGWVRHGDSWGLRYEDQCAVELAVRLPGGIECAGPLAGVGFAKRGAPLRRRDGCLWPEDSIKHSMGPGLAGELDFPTSLFRAWLVGGASAGCRP